MKAHLLALLLTAATPALAQAAPTSTEAAQPFKGATIIIIHTSDSASVAYTKLARLLLAEGYPLAKTDKELGYINTEYRATVNSAVLAALRLVIVPEGKGSRIESRGMYHMNSGPLQGESAIVMRGAFGSPAGIAWQEMARFTALYTPATLTYRR